ncbi:MAG: glycosyltransferase family 4 protein, partial [Bacteroidota bacterium]|nr:glycosyltransferase family 4 protein [Bacteroidota bacterium]MDX5429624.1 glycosyltransferase family 4 protein [Bacteroidota bacterium]MDX5468408.1 glycosyltransferase family 4 protein [Bacteroidota bacterium]
DDIHACYGIDKSRIDVVYNGASSLFSRSDEASLANFRQKKMEGRPWFVYVGALHPRKNIGRLLEAFDAFKHNDNQGYRLVIIGRKAWQTEELEATYSALKHREDVVFTGRISDEEMVPYLSGATALTYLPVFEGFGLPILEAFQCGTPAITSNVSSLPEVAGAGALVVDPFSVEAIAKAMLQMTQDHSLEQKLRKAADARAKDFSWDRTAEAVWQSIEKVIFGRA